LQISENQQVFRDFFLSPERLAKGKL
jgi:hypothetical protein